MESPPGASDGQPYVTGINLMNSKLAYSAAQEQLFWMVCCKCASNIVVYYVSTHSVNISHLSIAFQDSSGDFTLNAVFAVYLTDTTNVSIVATVPTVYYDLAVDDVRVWLLTAVKEVGLVRYDLEAEDISDTGVTVVVDTVGKSVKELALDTAAG